MPGMVNDATYALATHLSCADILNATSNSSTPTTEIVEILATRYVPTQGTFLVPAGWGRPRDQETFTSAAEQQASPWQNAGVLMLESSAKHPSSADIVVKHLGEFADLAEGWDGENAAAPLKESIDDAIRFTRAIGNHAIVLEPTLHVDGTAMLEIQDGSGTMRFLGNGKIAYSIDTVGNGTVDFDGHTVDRRIINALFV